MQLNLLTTEDLKTLEAGCIQLCSQSLPIVYRTRLFITTLKNQMKLKPNWNGYMESDVVIQKELYNIQLESILPSQQGLEKNMKNSSGKIAKKLFISLLA